MPEATTFSFDLRETTEALIKQHNVHEGYWLVGVEFGLSAGLMGITQADAKPSAMLQINRFQLTKVENPEAVPHAVDAAKVNPQIGASKSTKPAKNRPKA